MAEGQKVLDLLYLKKKEMPKRQSRILMVVLLEEENFKLMLQEKEIIFHEVVVLHDTVGLLPETIIPQEIIHLETIDTEDTKADIEEEVQGATVQEIIEALEGIKVHEGKKALEGTFHQKNEMTATVLPKGDEIVHLKAQKGEEKVRSTRAHHR